MFIPIGTTRPRLRTPWVTYGLMGMNLVVFLFEAADPSVVRGLAFVPASPNPVTWFASLFAHAGLLHLGGNMLFLWLFGTVAEDVLGPLVFLAFYFGGAVGATLLDWSVSAAVLPASLLIPHLGASGAIAGLMGLSAVCFMRTKVRVAYFFMFMFVPRWGIWDAPIALFGGLWVAWEVFQGTAATGLAVAVGGSGGGVAHWAHVGGFAAGLTAALLLRLRARVARQDLLTGTARLEDTSGFFSQTGELERLVSEAPGDADSWYALGQAQEMSGRFARATQAYGQALQLYLQQHSLPKAAEAYAAMKEYAKPQSLPPDVLFDLACALDDVLKVFEAYDLFLLTAQTHAGQPIAETALIRAGELARTQLNEPDKAAFAFRALLDQYPFSSWAALAQEGLRSLNLPPPPPAVIPAKPPDPDLHGLQ